MMTLQERLKPLRAAPPSTIDLAAWIAAWAPVRHQFEMLIDEHQRCNPDFHPQWTMSLLETLDESVRELAYRKTWLAEQLARCEEAH
jgi:hypothetical protein